MTTINLEGASRLDAAKLKREILDQLIEESLLEQAANRLGIYISDIDLQNRIKLIAQNQNLTVLQLKDAVEARNIDYLKYLKNLRKRIQIEELFRIQVHVASTRSLYQYSFEQKNIQRNQEGVIDIRFHPVALEVEKVHGLTATGVHALRTRLGH